MLEARGVDLDDPDDRTSAAEWLAAHRADQAAEDRHRTVIDEADLLDADRDLAPADHLAEARRDDVEAGPLLETAVPDMRELSVPDSAERVDPVARSI